MNKSLFRDEQWDEVQQYLFDLLGIKSYSSARKSLNTEEEIPEEFREEPLYVAILVVPKKGKDRKDWRYKKKNLVLFGKAKAFSSLTKAKKIIDPKIK